MSRNGNFNGYHDVLVRLIGGEGMREVFEPIWRDNGPFPSRAILAAFPQLTRTEEARALADHWGLPKPSELPVQPRQRTKRTRVSAERLWPELEPMVRALIEEAAGKHWIADHGMAAGPRVY